MRPRQKVNVSSAAVAADWLRQELGKGELSCLFRRKDLIVHTPRVGEAGYIPPTESDAKHGVDYGPAQVQPISTPQIKALVEVRYDVGRNKMVPAKDADGCDVVDPATKQPSRRKHWQADLFPSAAATSAIEGGRIGEGTPNLRDLHGVTHTPILRPDGSVLDVPGYDQSTGILYLPDRGLTTVPVPNRPTSQQIRDAVEFIQRPIAEFPFVQDAHRANWLGFAFTPLLRPLLPPPYPAGMIDATNPGSGKSFLATMLIGLHGGVLKGALPSDSDEIRKAITSVLVDTTAPVVLWDNVTGVVRSATLEALLTSATWSDRWLGQNRDISATNDRIWMFTGNNAKIGGDLARRTIWISIDPGIPDPQKRTGFKLHPPTWIKQHRGQYLAAMLTIARAWILDGAPRDVTRSDSYADWAGALRGMLTWANVPGLFGGEDADEAVDSSDDAEWATFLQAIYDSFAVEPFTVKRLVERLGPARIGEAGVTRIDTALLPGDLAHKFSTIRNGDDGDFRKSLGWWLKNRAGRFVRGWTVRRTSGRDARVVSYGVQPPPCGFAVSEVLLPPTRAEGGPNSDLVVGEEARAGAFGPPYGPNGREESAKTAKPQPPDVISLYGGNDAVCPDCAMALDAHTHATCRPEAA